MFKKTFFIIKTLSTQVTIYFRLIKNYKKLARRKNLSFYIFTIPPIGFFLYLISKIIIKSKNRYLANLFFDIFVFKSIIRFLSPEEKKFISEILKSYNLLSLNEIKKINPDNEINMKVLNLKNNGYCNLGKIFSDQECDNFIKILNGKDCFNSQTPMQSDGNLLKFDPTKDIFSKSNYSYFSFLPEITLSFLPIKNFLNDKNLVTIIKSYLNFESEIYSCVTWYNPKSKKAHYVHRLHRDPDDFKFLTMIIYWNKTDQSNGCVSYLKKSHNSTVSEEKKDFLTGPKGQVYLADLFGLHAGGKILDKYRYVTYIRFGKLHNHASTIDAFVTTPV